MNNGTWNAAELREDPCAKRQDPDAPLPAMSSVETHRWYAGQIINGFTAECRMGKNLSDKDMRDMAARAHFLAKLMVDMEPPA